MLFISRSFPLPYVIIILGSARIVKQKNFNKIKDLDALFSYLRIRIRLLQPPFEFGEHLEIARIAGHFPDTLSIAQHRDGAAQLDEITVHQQ
jgi:hypothetical protein